MKLDFLRTESYRRGIAFSVVFNLLARGVGFFTSLVIAFYFGTRSDADVYFYCAAALSFIVSIAASLNSSVVIPEAMRLSAQEGRREAMKFANTVLYWYAAGCAVISVLMLLNPVGAFLAVSRFDAALLNDNAALLYLAAPLLFLQLGSAYLLEVAASQKFFTAPMISNAAVNLTAVICIFCFQSSAGIKSIMWGLLAGNLLQLGFLVYMFKRQLQWDFSLCKLRVNAQVVKNALYNQLGNLGGTLAYYVPLYLLSGYGKGTISSLNYGKQVAEIPNYVLTFQFSSVAGIKLNELSAKRELDETKKVFAASAKFLVFLLAPLACFMWLYSREIIIALFRRGSFGAQSVELCSVFVKYFALALPFMAANALMVRLNIARQEIGASAGYQLAMSALSVFLAVVGIRFWGPAGYPLSFSALYAINFLTMWIYARRLYPWLDYAGIVKYTIKILAVNMAIAVVLALLKSRAQLPALPALIIGALIYGGLLAAVNAALRLNSDTSDIISMITAKLTQGARNEA